MCETTPISATKNCLDREIAEKMRTEHFEPFITLVRMHLLSFESFELDLNADDKDHLIEKAKKRKFNFPKKAKGCAYTKTSSPGERIGQALTPEGITQIKQLIEFLVEEKNVIQEGIFRRTGSVSRQNELKSLVTSFAPLNLSAGGYTVHDCASVLKNFLAELPEPLLTDLYYQAHCQIADLCNMNDESTRTSREERLLHILQLLLLLLPDQNRYLLQILLEMLHTTIQHENKNKMSADSLATLFTPHLICPRKLSPEQLHSISQQMSSVVSFMITKGISIFDIPPKLATDIRAFFMEQKRKKELLEKQQLLDESVSDSTVNTVYTFVDQVKTAEENNSNPTDTALAQLYAHIQTLPESSRKRKLIKKFNKENGQGTPLQTVMLNRLKNAGSTSTTPIGHHFKSILGDSIKKHIFHKGIKSKTPKRTHIPSSPSSFSKQPKRSSLLSSQFETPTRPSTSAGPSTCKSRVLFTSPVIPSSPSSSTLLKRSASCSLQSIADSINKTDKLMKKSANPILQNHTEKKNVAFSNTEHNDKDDSTFEYSSELNAFSDSSNSCGSSINDVKSHHKSEPNLNSHILSENSVNGTPPYSALGEFHKIIRGVSMGNLRLCPFSAERKPAKKTDATLTKRRQSFVHFKENVDLFVDTPKKNFSFNRDLLPEDRLLGRKSMSPITKSTQRMPKYMQESIMTPRSRKPVMLFGLTMINSSDPNNHAQNQSGFHSLPEEEEEDDIGESSICRSKSETDLHASRIDSECHFINTKSATANKNDDTTKEQQCTSAPNSLTSTFSRSVLSASPVDSSFSSHPDDFGSTADIRDLSESEMSESLLYCLNGNQPLDLSNASAVSNTEGDPQDRRFPAVIRKLTSCDNHGLDIDKEEPSGVKAKKFIFVKNEDIDCNTFPGETTL